MRGHLALSLACSLGCLLGSLAVSSTCPAQGSTWIKVQTKNSPGIRWSHGNAHDFIRGQTIIFGGGAGTAKGNDTWVYDGKDWTQVQPKTKPPARRLVTMSFHFSRVNTVMFGGMSANSNAADLNDTWVWDGKDWTQMKPQNSPSVRIGHGMVFDSARQRTVLFGGVNASWGNIKDTWEWDGTNWTQIQTKNSPPGGYTGLAYDSARKRVVLFGGLNSNATLSDETWEYDGKDWTKMSPKAKPPGRWTSAIAYDSARKRTVLFGGTGANFATVGDTWEYDGTTWVQVKTATQITSHRDFDALVYDQRRKRMVVYGGILNGAVAGDTWEYVASQPLTGTPATISIASGGAHQFALDAGTANASRLYWIFGSVTGTSPGVTLASAAGSVNIPLNPDFWTDLTIALANTPLLTKTRGTLDGSGKGTATFNVPKITNASAIGVKFHHAFLVYDASSNFYMASNPVELTLAK